MRRGIVGFHLDDEHHWVAELECGHGQHMRHDPPWQMRPWTQTAPGRAARIGARVDCLKCDRGEPPADGAGPAA
ncbi:DUF3565 domain-containing protein [Cupriavidus sp. 30B13]|uniref:DUF3565 domain-containing protein n=1 Tax=Cupriavidus sp. 30B13 TaxID=3384241 RepID=UPI003B90F361